MGCKVRVGPVLKGMRNDMPMASDIVRQLKQLACVMLQYSDSGQGAISHDLQHMTRDISTGLMIRILFKEPIEGEPSTPHWLNSSPTSLASGRTCTHSDDVRILHTHAPGNGLAVCGFPAKCVRERERERQRERESEREREQDHQHQRSQDALRMAA